MEEIQEVREETNGQSTGTNPYVIPVSILIAGGLIAGAVLYADRATTGNTPGQQATAGAAITMSATDLTDDDPVLGNPEAPLTIVEFADFQCPFCGKFFSTVEQQIIEQYVKTGKVRFVYRDFPLNAIHPEAQKAAEAAGCAGAQGKYWEYHDRLYQRQAELSPAIYRQWAKDLGLNAAQFEQCLNSGQFAAEVQKDYADGEAAGVTGTPATFVGTRFMGGALPFDGSYRDDSGQMQPGFKIVIEEELAKLSK